MSVTPTMREKLHASLIKLRDKYRAGVKRSRYKAELEEYNARLGLHADIRDFEGARKQTACDVEEYFGFAFYHQRDAERDAYLTRVRRSVLRRKVGDVDEAITVPGNKVLFNMIFSYFCAAGSIPQPARRRNLPGLCVGWAKVVKSSDPCCGIGIYKFRYKDDETTRALHKELYGEGYVVEEVLRSTRDGRIEPACAQHRARGHLYRRGRCAHTCHRRAHSFHR